MTQVQADLTEALRRFTPFVFSLDTENKDNVDLKFFHDAFQKSPQFEKENIYVVDVKEVCSHFVTVADPNLSGEIAEVKAQLNALNDGGGDGQAICHALLHKYNSIALQRETARLEEIQAAKDRHEALVERFVEDGLSEVEAEAMATKEEEAENLDEDGEPIVEERPNVYIMLKHFPTTADHVTAMSRAGVPFHSVFNVNSKGKVGKKEEVVDPKGKKKPDMKKPDAKKGKKDDSGAGAEPLAALIAKELANLAPLEESPLLNVNRWAHDVTCAEIEDPTGKHYEVKQSEAELVDLLLRKIMATEEHYYNYRNWRAEKEVAVIPKLKVSPPVVQPVVKSDIAKEDDKSKKAGSKAPVKKKGKEDEALVSEAVVVAPVVEKPYMPTTMADVPVPDELYKRLLGEIHAASVTPEIQMHCLLEQIRETRATARKGSIGGPNVDAQEVCVQKYRADVTDFVDYVLAQLDGTEQDSYNEARQRFLHEGNESFVCANSLPPAVVYADQLVRLEQQDGHECDELLLGNTLSAYERELTSTVRRPHLVSVVECKEQVNDEQEVRTLTDVKDVLMGHVKHATSITSDDVEALFTKRRCAELLTRMQLRRRLDEISQTSSTLQALIVHNQLDGSAIVCIWEPVPSQVPRRLYTSSTFHGEVYFPQWLDWVEYVAAEELRLNPPPVEEDEEEELQPEPEPEVEEEEEEYDENGELIIREKKEEKKEVIPEYINFEEKETHDHRLLGLLDHVKLRLEERQERFYATEGATAKAIASEVHSMYPSDGCVITTTVTRGNTLGARCTVTNDDVSFGFRSHLRHRITTADLTSGVFGVISFRDGTTVAASTCLLGSEDGTYTKDCAIQCGFPGMSLKVQDSALLFSRESARSLQMSVLNPQTMQVENIFAFEQSLSVDASGAVVATFEGGIRANIYPDMRCAVLYKDCWLFTATDGRRVAKLADGSVHALSPSLIATHYDLELQAHITLREDGVKQVVFDSGETIVQHDIGAFVIDGGSLRYVCDGLPAVCTDVDCRTVSVQFPNEVCITLAATSGEVYVTQTHKGIEALITPAKGQMFVRPSQRHGLCYACDFVFGGLKVVDGEKVFRVTPRGRSRLDNVEPPPPPPEDDLRPIIEVVSTDDPISLLFASEAEKLGMAIENGVDRQGRTPQCPDLPWYKGRTAAFVKPPKSRQAQEKERSFSSQLAQLIPSDDVEMASGKAPHVFWVGVGEKAVEIMRRGDIRDNVRDIGALSDATFSDVYADATSVIVSHAEAKKPVEPVNQISVFKKPVNGNQPTVASYQLQIRTGLLDHHTNHADGPLIKATVRHFVNVGAAMATPIDDLELGDGNACYGAAAQQLVEHIPAVIRAQLVDEPDDGEGQSSDDAHSGAASSPIIQGRKPFPTPIPEKSGALSTVKKPVTNFWKEGGESLIPQLEEENEQYKKPKPEPEHEPEQPEPQAEAEEAEQHDAAEEPVDAGDVDETASRDAEEKHVYEDPKHMDGAILTPTRPTESPGLSRTPLRPRVSHVKSLATSQIRCPGSSTGPLKPLPVKKQQKLAVSPASVNFGNVLESFRYCMTLQLTNVGPVAIRCRIKVSEPWVDIDWPKGPIAAGVSVRLVATLDGTLPPGESHANITIVSESAELTVPVKVITASGSDGQFGTRTNVKMIGPAKMKYVPVFKGTASVVHNQLDDDSDGE